VQIEDPEGHVMYERQGLSTADFQFTAPKEGEYKLCFTAKGACVGRGGHPYTRGNRGPPLHA
jgi:hypothetical protein